MPVLFIMGQYSIKDIEQLSGIKAHTIRIWEQRYQLIAPKRTDTNIRYYDDDQLKYLLNVSMLNRHGHKISKISQWSDQKFNEEIRTLYEKSMLHDDELNLDLGANDMMTAMIDMDAEKFDRIYENSVRNVGFRKTIDSLIYPFLEKVGILWSLDQINPAHEHFMSCLIRQKVISAIDRLPEPAGGDRFLLFLPEGEHHELGLLLAHFILKQHGAKVFYMGQDLPSANLNTAITTVSPDFVLTFIVDPAVRGNTARLINGYLEQVGKAKLLVATRPSQELDDISHPQLQYLHSIDSLMEAVTKK